MDQQSCSNCHQVVTDKLGPDGKPLAVWVCENCGTSNASPVQPEAQPAVSTPPMSEPAAAMDSAAQADINAAASAAAPEAPVAPAVPDAAASSAVANPEPVPTPPAANPTA